MSRKGPRQVFFVCAGMSTDGTFISKEIKASSPDEASKEFDGKVHSIWGPYLKKRTQVLDTTRELKFASHEAKKAIYNDWVVNAFTLIEPANHAYLVFIKRLDDKKIPLPKGTITAPVADLRFYENK
jgi:hypothetical protein